MERARPRQTRLTHCSLGASLLIGFEGTVRSNHSAGVQSRIYWRGNLPRLVLGGQAAGLVAEQDGGFIVGSRGERKKQTNQKKRKEKIRSEVILKRVAAVIMVTQFPPLMLTFTVHPDWTNSNSQFLFISFLYKYIKYNSEKVKILIHWRRSNSEGP